MAPSPTQPSSINLSRRSVLAGAVGAAAAAGATPAFASPRPERAPLPPGGHRVTPADDGDDLWSDRILYQTSFEDGDPDWITDPLARYDTGVSHSGATSLRYDRPPPADPEDELPYGLLNRRFPTEPGRYYSATAWTRSKSLVGAQHRGAMLAFQAYTFGAEEEEPEWITGSTAPTGGQPEAETWFEHSVHYQTPPEAIEVEVALYLFKGMTGTAWFDDLVVTAHAPRAITTSLVSPSFRGLLIPGDHDEVRIDTVVDPLVDSSFTIRTTILDSSDQVVVSTDSPATPEVTFSHPAADLAPGRYRIVIEAITGDRTVRTEEWGIEKVTTTPATWTDRHGRLIRDGVPLFPLGMYTSRDNPLSLSELVDTPLDTLLSYVPPTAAEMDDAADKGIKMIYPLNTCFHDASSVLRPPEIRTIPDEVPYITNLVEQYRDHPALLGWYLADELRIEQYQAQVSAHHEAVIETDPDHPTFYVDNKPPVPGGDYIRTADVFGMDSYPIFWAEPGEDLPEPQRLARAAAREIPNRTMWHAPQSFSWGARTQNKGRFPTAREFRNVTWQMVTEGATGLFWFNLYDMRADDAAIGDGVAGRTPLDVSRAILIAGAQEIADLIPALLSVEVAPDLTVPEADWLNTTTRTYEGQGYLFAVNNTFEDQGSVTVEAPSAISVEVLGEDRMIEVDGSFTDSFAGVDVHLYRITLATAQTLADLTEQLLNEAGVPNASQEARRARHHLELADRHHDGGRDRPHQNQLDRFRTIVRDWEGDFLTSEQSARLVRLSEHLT